jgi:flavin-dependent dehydrogenase
MPMVVRRVLELDELRDLVPEAFVEADTQYMRHTFRFADPYLAPMNPEVGAGASTEERLSLWMVRRSVFDHALALRAARAGADLREGIVVRRVTIDGDGPVHLDAIGGEGGWNATADVVIGADGANGVVARSVGLRSNRALAIAIEAEVPHRWGDGHTELRPDVCHLEYGAVRRGYAWVFPKGDHLNVGAGVFRPRNLEGRGDSTVRTELRRAIVDYIEMLGVPHREEQLDFHAHPLPIWNGLDSLQTRNGRVLLAGDAAGLINPFFGDGILHALKSGKIAANAIITGEREGYTAAIGREFSANFDSALKLAKVFYQWPGLCYRHGVKRPGATRTATRLLCGELLFNDVSGRVRRRLREAMRAERRSGMTLELTGDEPAAETLEK